MKLSLYRNALLVRVACCVAFCASACLAACTTLRAAEPSGWQAISQEITSKVKPGYPGKTAGVTVDPASGDVFMVVPDQGMWKSVDHGDSFTRVDGEAIGGRCETGFALNFDPAGKQLMCFMIYGSSALTRDEGRTWQKSQTSHLDFGAVDWNDTGKCFLGLRHESGGVLTKSLDEGTSWTDLEKGFTALGVFDHQCYVACRGKGEGIVRSDDGGQTWKKVSDVTPPGCVMRTLKDAGYWATEQGLLVSRDRGEHWQIEGKCPPAVFGPFWSIDPKRFVVVNKDGFQETLDGGETWKLAAPLPPEYVVVTEGTNFANYAWDSVGDIFYASTMGKDTFRLKR